MSHQAIRVLLIEDEESFSAALQKQLAKIFHPTYHVECVQKLRDGLDRLAGGGVDVVLLDLRLPDSQGLDTFLKLHAHARDLPVVLLTVTDDDLVAVEAIRNGAQDYLVKGETDVKVLSRVMQYAIERKRAERMLQEARETLEQRIEERTRELTEAKERLEREVLDRRRTEETLQREKIALERLNHVMFDREERILELKQEVDALLKELGKEARFHA